MNYLIAVALTVLPFNTFAINKFSLEKCSTVKSIAELNKSKNFRYSNNSLSKWINLNESTREISIIIHGLNNKPQIMHSIENILINKEHAILRVALVGHHGDLEEAKQIKPNQWINDLFLHYCLIHNLSNKKKLSVNLVGFSLGGLLSVTLVGMLPKSRISKMILFAPALKVHWYVNLINYLWFENDYIITSKTPIEYRSQHGTTLAMYRALFFTIKNLAKTNFSKLNIPTTIFIDPLDEFVSFKKIKYLRKLKGLSRWNIIEIKKDKTTENNFNHLIIDANSVGINRWNGVVKTIEKFLLN